MTMMAMDEFQMTMIGRVEMLKVMDLMRVMRMVELVEVAMVASSMGEAIQVVHVKVEMDVVGVVVVKHVEVDEVMKYVDEMVADEDGIVEVVVIAAAAVVADDDVMDGAESCVESEVTVQVGDIADDVVDSIHALVMKVEVGQMRDVAVAVVDGGVDASASGVG